MWWRSSGSAVRVGAGLELIKAEVRRCCRQSQRHCSTRVNFSFLSAAVPRTFANQSAVRAARNPAEPLATNHNQGSIFRLVVTMAGRSGKFLQQCLAEAERRWGEGGGGAVQGGGQDPVFGGEGGRQDIRGSR